jgi:hypothetical protein
MMKFVIESHTNPDEPYEVWAKRMKDDFVAWQCMCKGHKYRGTCRHVLLAQQCIENGLREMVEVSD